MERLVTMEDYRKVHVALWQWLSEHPQAEKQDWPGWADVHPDDVNLPRCMPCLFSIRKAETFHTRCGECPIKNWAMDSVRDCVDRCHDEGSCYDPWLEADDDSARSSLAKQVRDLKWTEGGEENGKTDQ